MRIACQARGRGGKRNVGGSVATNSAAVRRRERIKRPSLGNRARGEREAAEASHEGRVHAERRAAYDAGGMTWAEGEEGVYGCCCGVVRSRRHLSCCRLGGGGGIVEDEGTGEYADFPGNGRDAARARVWSGNGSDDEEDEDFGSEAEVDGGKEGEGDEGAEEEDAAQILKSTLFMDFVQ